MRSIFFKFSLFLGFLSLSLQAADNQSLGKYVQIVLDRNSGETGHVMIIDTKGRKELLTLGSLLEVTARSWIDESNLPVPRDPDTIAIIKFEKNPQGKIVAKLLGPQENAQVEILNLGSFLSLAAVSYPGCALGRMKERDVDVKLKFKYESNGKLSSKIQTQNGDEEFNFGELIKFVVLSLNYCRDTD